MSSNLATMSANLATMASALASMSSNLATMSSSLATTTVTNATSTAPSIEQSEDFRLAPANQIVYILSYTACKWQGRLDTPDWNKPDLLSDNPAHGTLGVYVSQELAKDAGRRWLMEALDNQFEGTDLTDEKKRVIEQRWNVPEINKNGIWKRGWMESGDHLEEPRELSLMVEIVGRELETTSDRADGNDGEGQSDKAVGEETQDQRAEDKAK